MADEATEVGWLAAMLLALAALFIAVSCVGCAGPAPALLSCEQACEERIEACGLEDDVPGCRVRCERLRESSWEVGCGPELDALHACGVAHPCEGPTRCAPEVARYSACIRAECSAGDRPVCPRGASR